MACIELKVSVSNICNVKHVNSCNPLSVWAMEPLHKFHMSLTMTSDKFFVAIVQFVDFCDCQTQSTCMSYHDDVDKIYFL